MIKSLSNFISWIKLYWKGGDFMMIAFLATRIVIGKLKFKDLPEVLQPKVKEVLEENGVGFLAEEEE